MELIDQHTKRIMEGCKERARDAGLSFSDETLEYIVSNRDLLELTPKNMIPTMYDYWVHDVEVMRERGRYELYPDNPFETVINTRPAISFYNDNNPDWLNVMIFYHVLAHIDFFQNNLYFRHTWDFDFTAQALADKRLIAQLRSRYGRWVDYVIEFSLSIDNLVDYHGLLGDLHRPRQIKASSRIDYYFDIFLQQIRKVRTREYLDEIDRYNACVREAGELCEQAFFADTVKKYPEFEALYQKHVASRPKRDDDLMLFLLEHSEFLNREENKWMQSVLHVVRNTSLYFQPQIRTKIMNEGWASYWHEELFLTDDRIRGHEINFARVNAFVTALPRVGLNPYAIGLRLFRHIEEKADRGQLDWDYQKLRDRHQRAGFDRNTGRGKETIFLVRENLSDFLFINQFVDQDFIDRYRLFVSEKRLNEERMVWEYRVGSRRAEDYRRMLLDSLYHPPRIRIDASSSDNGTLKLVHVFEGRPLVQEYIHGTMIGIEYLWGGPVELETHEMAPAPPSRSGEPAEPKWIRVRYRMQQRQLKREELDAA
ncbi:stage V sporulation protein R [Geothermobacter ehrlichii]|uniref:Stage V sporulation protein R n=1 Tax=Geothermobacter ehrlichii TaxID=213224 RepID=A0A5D3WJP3_9BACT|nr:SpoVR family protein [Geothermobacter ehrlichii]TYO98097.1 stage V sporulation protein R [Geothermobacter ehrlichii]